MSVKDQDHPQKISSIVTYVWIQQAHQKSSKRHLSHSPSNDRQEARKYGLRKHPKERYSYPVVQERSKQDDSETEVYYDTDTEPADQGTPYPCPKCEKRFPFPSDRDVHAIGHNTEKKHKCKSCERSYFIKSDLTKHEKVHKNVK